MAVTTLVKTARTVIAEATSNAAAATTRGVLDLRTKSGGMLTIKLTNGGTGPTIQATANVLIAHDSGSVPAAGSAGATWKTIFSYGGGTTANAITEQSIAVDASIMHIEVEVTGNTAQAVVCEAFLSELTSFDTV